MAEFKSDEPDIGSGISLGVGSQSFNEYIHMEYNLYSYPFICIDLYSYVCITNEYTLYITALSTNVVVAAHLKINILPLICLLSYCRRLHEKLVLKCYRRLGKP